MKNLNPFSWVVLVIVVISFTAIAFGIRDDRRAAEVAQRALCAQQAVAVHELKIDKQTLMGAQDFLKTHPNGGIGFSRAQIEAGIKRDKDNVKADKENIAALSDVECS